MSKIGGLSLTVACALFATTMQTADAQVIYRGMNRDGAAPLQPQVANTALGLGVRPQDVGNPGPADPVPPTVVNPNPPPANLPQGTSVVVNDPCSLPAFSRPPGVQWNGTAGANVRVFQLNTANLPGTLSYQAAPVVGNADHGVIGTNGGNNPQLTLAQMQAAIGGTAANWAIVAAPPAPCP